MDQIITLTHSQLLGFSLLMSSAAVLLTIACTTLAYVRYERRQDAWDRILDRINRSTKEGSR